METAFHKTRGFLPHETKMMGVLVSIQPLINFSFKELNYLLSYA